MKKKEIDSILQLHKEWLLDNTKGKRADLRRADLRRAVLTGVKTNEFTVFFEISCPSDGAFIAWKKVDGKLIKLLVPEDAKRSSATSYKCRCDKAKVLDITDLKGENHYESVINRRYESVITYTVGEMVYPDKFDDDRWNECSNGIHFFINKNHAINY